MRRSDNDAFLVDILLAGRDAIAFARGVSEETYRSDRVLQLALQKLVEDIGRAAGRLSPEALAKLPMVPEKLATSTRHPFVDLQKLWQIVTTDLQPLVAAIEPIVPLEEASS